MKALLGLVGGFVLTLAVFACGLAFATWLLAAKPVRQATPAIGVSELWTKDAQRVDPATQNLQRIPARQASAAASAGANAAGDAGLNTAAEGVVATAQAAAPQAAQAAPSQSGEAGAASAAQPAPENATSAELPAAHVEWCASRYRSYRPEENSYRSYSGEIRPCISPYFDAGADRTASTGARQAADQAETESYTTTVDGYATTYGGPLAVPEEQASADGSRLSADHVGSCFSRYRSYRQEDNTYQPYDGGPRRQCE
ncbi:BA14K family protein [Mesorhizobium sp. B1-1-8]|uniref:BA14K family protein n=1 Tax=Mesorhizobium sp. B1-1-8 TaxID=2589976 RepID=UPI001D02F430|nr:BA14K family protein [Mesorhizobium sp. B1-1-8]UCI06484.1 BA14K family protein [Mesorhizobium sp. B1-1-8]